MSFFGWEAVGKPIARKKNRGKILRQSAKWIWCSQFLFSFLKKINFVGFACFGRNRCLHVMSARQNQRPHVSALYSHVPMKVGSQKMKKPSANVRPEMGFSIDEDIITIVQYNPQLVKAPRPFRLVLEFECRRHGIVRHVTGQLTST